MALDPAALDGCAGLAAMRLHALVLATVGEIPAYAIPYDPKVEAFAEAIEAMPKPILAYCRTGGRVTSLYQATRALPR